MEVIKIVFFVLGVFFGENSRIGAEKTTVTVNSKEKEVVIVQEGLFALIKNERDSIQVNSELERIIARNWREEIKAYPSKSCTFHTTKEGNLNATIILNYSSVKDLKNFALEFNEETKEFSLINIPDWNIETRQGELKGNYWKFQGNNEFTFIVTPFKNMPEKLINAKKNLRPILEAKDSK
ncbi:hypothetical protein [uncultured Tenacibaculum sp.]|uniref:hypothetical protein n=1 Tax=uncultured Tenacibaculum sp. TaxID=174713 RepID=UPI0026195058|nr:hypothetical protein [uncultured Tenacibaculum sp.]